MRLFEKKKYRFMEFWLLALLLLSVELFGLVPFMSILPPNACFGFSLFILFILFTFYIRIPIWDIPKCSKPLLLFLATVVLSYIPAHLYFGQPYFQSFLTNRHMLLILSFPVLYCVRPTLKELRRAFYMFSIIYLLATLTVTFWDPHLIILPDGVPFKAEDDFVHTLPGIRLASMAFILSVNEFRKKVSISSSFWMVFHLLLLYLVQNRTSLLAAVLILIIGIRMATSARVRLGALGFGIVLGLFLFVYTASQWEILVEETIEQLLDPEYNRNKAFVYVFSHRELIRHLLGDSLISTNVHPLMLRLQEDGVFFSDIGLIGFWNQYGIVGTLTILVTVIKGLSKNRSFLVRGIALYFLVGIATLSYFAIFESLFVLSLYWYLYFILREQPSFDTLPPRKIYSYTGRRYRSISAS